MAANEAEVVVHLRSQEEDFACIDDIKNIDLSRTPRPAIPQVEDDAPAQVTEPAGSPTHDDGPIEPQENVGPLAGSSSILHAPEPTAPTQERPLNIPPFSDDGGNLVEHDEGTKRQWLVLRRFRKVCDTQRNVSSQRYLIQRRRGELARMRDDLSDLGTALLNMMNATPGLESSNASVFTDSLQAYQKAMNEYQAKEDDYSSTERQLDLEEFRLEEAEREFQTLLDNTGDRHMEAVFGDGEESDSPSHTPVPDVTTQYHPLVFEYHSQLGRADHLAEELGELSAERDGLLEEQQTRRRHGLELGVDALATLHELQGLEMEMLREFEETQKEIMRLKLECDKLGLDTEEHDDYDAQSDVDDSEGSMASWTIVDPLDQWRKSSPSFYEQPEVVHRNVNTGEFINKWLLHQLCQSSFEIHRLRAYVEQESLPPDDEDDFRQLVLDKWATEPHGTTKPRSEASNPRSSQYSNINEWNIVGSNIPEITNALNLYTASTDGAALEPTVPESPFSGAKTPLGSSDGQHRQPVIGDSNIELTHLDLKSEENSGASQVESVDATSKQFPIRIECESQPRSRSISPFHGDGDGLGLTVLPLDSHGAESVHSGQTQLATMAEKPREGPGPDSTAEHTQKSELRVRKGRVKSDAPYLNRKHSCNGSLSTGKTSPLQIPNNIPTSRSPKGLSPRSEGPGPDMPPRHFRSHSGPCRQAFPFHR